MTKPLKKAVFPVGGLGTRFLPATKCMPKEMLPIASKPLIQYAFEEAVNAGIEQFIFITGRNKHAIMDHFDHSYELESVLSEKEKLDALALSTEWMPKAGEIAFIRQQEPLGLGHAVWCARDFIADEPFAILLADEMLMTKGGFLKQMAEVYAQTGGNVVALGEVPLEQTSRYGIVSVAEEKKGIVTINGMVEKPQPAKAPSCLSIAGRYIMQPDIFKYLENAERGSGGEIQLTDAMQKLLGVSPFYGVKFTGKRFDCGNAMGFLEANVAYAMEENPQGVREMLGRLLG